MNKESTTLNSLVKDYYSKWVSKKFFPFPKRKLLHKCKALHILRWGGLQPQHLRNPVPGLSIIGTTYFEEVGAWEPTGKERRLDFLTEKSLSHGSLVCFWRLFFPSCIVTTINKKQFQPILRISGSELHWNGNLRKIRICKSYIYINLNMKYYIRDRIKVLTFYNTALL